MDKPFYYKIAAVAFEDLRVFDPKSKFNLHLYKPLFELVHNLILNSLIVFMAGDTFTIYIILLGLELVYLLLWIICKPYTSRWRNYLLWGSSIGFCVVDTLLLLWHRKQSVHEGSNNLTIGWSLIVLCSIIISFGMMPFLVSVFIKTKAFLQIKFCKNSKRNKVLKAKDKLVSLDGKHKILTVKLKKKQPNLPSRLKSPNSKQKRIGPSQMVGSFSKYKLASGSSSPGRCISPIPAQSLSLKLKKIDTSKTKEKLSVKTSAIPRGRMKY